MRVTGIGMTLHGEEGAASPPLPFIEVDDNEGNALIALYPAHVAIVSDVLDTDTDTDDADRLAESERLAAEWAAGEEAARIAAQEEEAERQRVAANPVAFTPGSPAELAGAHRIADRMSVDPAVTDAINGGALLDVEEGVLVEGEPGPSDVVEGTGGETNTEMADAIDLLDPLTGFVKNGARKGRPKVEAVADILGRDVTIAEIDAAFIAKAATE